jgi:hypothetical protein
VLFEKKGGINNIFHQWHLIGLHCLKHHWRTTKFSLAISSANVDSVSDVSDTVSVSIMRGSCDGQIQPCWRRQKRYQERRAQTPHWHSWSPKKTSLCTVDVEASYHSPHTADGAASEISISHGKKRRKNGFRLIPKYVILMKLENLGTKCT